MVTIPWWNVKKKPHRIASEMQAATGFFPLRVESLPIRKAGAGMMEKGFEEGFVVAVADGVATVRVGRHAECSSCGACGAARQAVVEACDDIGAKAGDHVRFTVPEHSVVLGSLIVFAVPVALALVLGVCGALVEGGGTVANGTLGGLVGAAVGLAIGGGIVRWFDRRAAAQQPRIVEILSS